jgi:hypothetical protein
VENELENYLLEGFERIKGKVENEGDEIKFRHYPPTSMII